MEMTEAISEGEWSSLSGMYTAEEAIFMSQLLNNSSNSFVPNSSSAAYWSSHENGVANLAVVDEGSYYYSSSSQKVAQESSDFSGRSCSQIIPRENYYLSNSLDHHPVIPLNSCLGNLENNDGCYLFEDDDESMKQEVSEPNLEVVLTKPEPGIESSKKRSRCSGEVQKRRNVRSKKTQKQTSISNNEEDGGNVGHGRQSTSGYCSEDESNASQDLNGEGNSISNPKEPSKTRASRGSATDPQSLYARKRRERINERLKILQNLVPNGTKVDISTMLEEAVQYVKFLQLQIKLLSSDDLWMYSPIAYNGMDIGLNLNMNTPLPKES